jgi:hypothetical protein
MQRVQRTVGVCHMHSVAEAHRRPACAQAAPVKQQAGVWHRLQVAAVCAAGAAFRLPCSAGRVTRCELPPVERPPGVLTCRHEPAETQ